MSIRIMDGRALFDYFWAIEKTPALITTAF